LGIFHEQPAADAGDKALSATSAPTQPHTKTNTGKQSTSQLSPVSNRDETSLLAAHLYNAYGNSPYSSSTTTTFASGVGIAHAPGARSRAVAIHYSCNWNDRFFVC
jgi:hypothetical protein